MHKLQPRGGLARNNTLLLKKNCYFPFPPTPPQQLCRKLPCSVLQQNLHGFKNLCLPPGQGLLEFPKFIFDNNY